MLYARIENGTVIEIIPSIAGLSLEQRFHPSIVAKLREVGLDVREGWVVQGDRLYPPPAVEVPANRQFVFLEFIGFFTEAERTAIVNSTETAVKLFLLMAAGASYIDLDDPRTVSGVGSLATLGLITNARRDAILTGPVTA